VDCIKRETLTEDKRIALASCVDFNLSDAFNHFNR
jgi:hypothetical protein